MKLWFDDADIRGCPKGWVRARDVREAMEIIGTGEVVEMSLDHDVERSASGYADGHIPDGTDLVQWMLATLPVKQWPHTIRIHSMSDVGAVRMNNLLMTQAPRFTEVIVDRFRPGMIEELSEGEENGTQKE